MTHLHTRRPPVLQVATKASTPSLTPATPEVLQLGLAEAGNVFS